MNSIERLSTDATRTYLSNVESTRSTAPAAPVSTGKGESGRTPDSVSLSTNARLLAAARTEVQNVPDVRENKVAAIKQQVDAGTYSVPAHVLARKMVEAAKTTT